MNTPSAALGFAPDDASAHAAFLGSSRKHVLVLTNHGVHEWAVTPGLPDTGGQNVFVNYLVETLVKLGFRVTVANRGGYNHPLTGQMQTGLRYLNADQRILYLEDDCREFVRKEDMGEHLETLASYLHRRLALEGSQPDLVISHYWDAAWLGILWGRLAGKPCRHLWVPHSLGILKKQNVSQEKWAGLRVDERIRREREILEEIDAVAPTSPRMLKTLRADYGYETRLYLPPCVHTERYFPREVGPADPLWKILSLHCGQTPEQIRASRIIAEISRTEVHKRKNILIEAFAKVHSRFPDTLLVVSVMGTEQKLRTELTELARRLGVEKSIAMVGTIWDHLPSLYAAAHIYCTPSVLEDFGMAVQEAAASRAAIVAGDRVTFATEYLLGPAAKPTPDGRLRIGSGAIAVRSDDVDAFAQGLSLVLENPDLRDSLAEHAYRITIPRFTWESTVLTILNELSVHPR